MSEIKKINLVSFIFGFGSFISGVIYTLYFLSNGLTQFQISQVFGIFMISLALFEIPTGSFADILGHKTSVGLGLFIHALSSFIFFLYPTFQGVLIGMLFASLGLAFISGAWSSLIYEILQKQKQIGDFQKIKSRADSYLLAGGIIGSPIGSFIFKSNHRLPFILSFFFVVLSSFIVFFIKWEFTKKPHSAVSFFVKMKEGIILTIRNPRLLAIVIIGIAISMTRLVYNQNINQPYQLSIGVDVGYIGFVAALVAGVQAIILAFSHKITKRIGLEKSILLTFLTTGTGVIVLSFLHSLFALMFILIFYMGTGFRESVFDYAGQKELTKGHRATMASTVAFLTTIVVGLLLPIWGKGIDLYGLRNILFLLGIFTLFIGSIGMTVYRYFSL